MRVIKSEFIDDLKIHRFTCLFCDTRFTRSNNLKVHLLSRCKVQNIPKDDIDEYMKKNHTPPEAKEKFKSNIYSLGIFLLTYKRQEFVGKDRLIERKLLLMKKN